MVFKKYRPCDDCGARNLTDNKYCSNCGRNLEEDGEESQEDVEVEQPEVKQKVKVGKVDDKFIDNETGSVWDITGLCVDGKLKGKWLIPKPHSNHFAFAWLTFHPDSEIYGQ